MHRKVLATGSLVGALLLTGFQVPAQEANGASATVPVIHTPSTTVLTTIPAGDEPSGAAVAPVRIPPHQTTGTSLVTHGLQLGGALPDCPFYLAEASRARAWSGRIFLYNKSSGSLDPCTHPACGPQGNAGETVVVFDWADDSDESGEGFSEAAAESLLAALVQWSQGDSPLVALEHLHLIGHSRGTVVNSEVAERLIAAGFPAPEQVTNLDPHDAGELGEDQRSWDDYDVNQEHPQYRCGPGDPPADPVGGICAWEDVGFQDTYWRNQDGWPCLLDPDGRQVPGSADMDGSDLDVFCHSDVHRWYYFTIDTAASTHPETGDPPGIDWFNPGSTTCSSSTRSGPLAPLAREVDGYNFSRTGGGTAARCEETPGEQEVHFDFNLSEGLVNGDFDREGSGGSDISGWSFHGGGGTANAATGGDNHLRLNAGEWRTHNRFYMPLGTEAVRFCRRVVDPGTSDTLTVQLVQGPDMHAIHEESLIATTGWECFDAPIQEDMWGSVSRLTFDLSDNGGGAEVGIDDIRLFVPLFADGFESGDTSAW